MSRRPALAPRWLKALAAWEDGDAEPMIAAMKAGFPKTEDEVMIFASFARRVGNFKRKRGRHRDHAVNFAAGIYDKFRRDGMSVDDALEATSLHSVAMVQLLSRGDWEEADRLGAEMILQPDKLRNYVTKGLARCR